MRRNTRHRGFTLAEAAIASTILAVLVVAALNASGKLAEARYDQADKARARSLADAMVGEIQPKAYSEPSGGTTTLGPDAGEGPTRATFDDVDDFNGDVESPPVDSSGVAVPGFTGWTRSVSVERVTPSGQAMVSSATDNGVLRVTVVVKKGNKEMARRVFLRSSAMDAAR